MSLQPGSTLFNAKYRVVRLLGAGRFGTVYLVREEKYAVERAIKLLSTADDGVGTTVYDDLRLRFRLEYQLGTRLDHSNVVRALAVEELGETVGLVMEFAAGGSLAQRLKAQGRLDLSEAIGILRDSARGLRALHGLDAIHRDVKPSNILLTSDGRAKVGDLGLAQVPGGPSGRTVLGDNALPHPGTPEYMSPEHRYPEALQPTSDVYSLGCVAWELLTGTVWHSRKHRAGSVAELRADVAPWLDAVVMRMLLEAPGIRQQDAADASKRFVDMDGVLVALDAEHGGSGPAAASTSLVSPTESAESSPSLDRAVACLDADRYEEAIAMLEALLSGGTKLRAVESLLADAREAQTQHAEVQRIRQEYAAIGSLARGKRSEARALDEWARFREEYPDWDEDPLGLAVWAEAHSTTVERRRLADAGRRQREAEALAESHRIAAAEAAAVARRKADADAAAQAKRKAESDAEAVRKADEARQLEAKVAEDLRKEVAKRNAERDAAEAIRKASEAALAKEPPTPSAEQQQLLNQMLDINAAPRARAEAGRKLATLGDPRPGVGLQPNGLPDIYWCEFPGSFSIGRYPITNSQYQAFIKSPDGYQNERWWREPCKLAARASSPGNADWPSANHPAENVSWYDAVAFARWLTARLRAVGDLATWQEIRLPTDQEWLVAATGGDSSREYPWGTDYRAGFANLDESGGAGGAYLRQTTAVGLYPQGVALCGAVDLTGNVWEWTLTEYESKRSDDLTNARPRVVRGGSWNYNPDNARSSYRVNRAPAYRFSYLGFRVVRGAPVR